ncbi:DUF2141 domain-containing protein [Aurantiacibacter suaedae]|uniref:DUF2141 domain-containing protein n=1 Tax=Aurantiacibacter suaedae TaxID=2545755 RepID=UPI0010F78082|nr:DUF2141 domain-containing protein [Aurantiacibacter suaedae]
MQNRQRPLLALIALSLAALPLAPALPTEGGVNVDVTVTDLRNTKGRIIACMTSDESHFPRCRDVAGSYKANAAAADSVVLHFAGVVPGTYAIALLHDENQNGRADRALTLIPREGFGFSRDAPVRMGPPSFEDAAFPVGATPISQTIRMRYLL